MLLTETCADTHLLLLKYMKLFQKRFNRFQDRIQPATKFI